MFYVFVYVYHKHFLISFVFYSKLAHFAKNINCFLLFFTQNKITF